MKTIPIDTIPDPEGMSDPGQIEITQRRIVIREAAVLLELLSRHNMISISLADRLETMAKRLRAVES